MLTLPRVKFRRNFGLVAATLMAGAFATMPAAAADFTGKQVEVIVPVAPGGSTDGYGRYVGSWLEKTLPGNPTVIVRNMDGGGTVVAANHFEAQGKSDGTTTMVVNPSMQLTFSMRAGDPEIQFDATKWKAYLAAPMGRVIYVNSVTGVKSVEDLKNLKTPLIMANSSPTGSDMPNLLSLYMLGAKVTPIFGFTGGDQYLATERGELTANGAPIPGYINNVRPLVAEGKIVPLFSFGMVNESGEFVRDPNEPDVPTFIEAYRTVHGEDPSGPAFEVWKSLYYMVVMASKSMVLPADTPQDIVDAYSQAAAKFVEENEFKTDGARLTGGYPQSTGEAAANILRGATAMNDELREWLFNWLRTEYDVEI